MPKAAHPTELRDRWRIRWIDEHDERQSAVYDTYKEAEYQLGLGLCAKDSRTKVGDYVRLAWRVSRKKPSADVVLEEVRVLGEEYTIEDAVSELENVDCYQGWQEEVRYFLFRYEEHLAKKNGQKYKNEQWQRIWEDSPSNSIENICPRSKGSEERHRSRVFVHRLGKLVLLEPGLKAKTPSGSSKSSSTSVRRRKPNGA